MPVLHNLFINSSNVSNKDAAGSKLLITLDHPIYLSETKKNYCRLLKSSVWFTHPNISAALGNNTVKFTYNAVVYTLTIADGIYDTEKVNDRIVELLINNSLPSDLIAWYYDASANRTSFQVKRVGLAFFIDFDTDNKLLKDNFGMTGSLTDPSEVFFEGGDPVNLNNVTAILVKASFCTGSTYNNEYGTDILDVIQIKDVDPNEQLHTQYFNPAVAQCNLTMLSQFTVQLTTENNNTPYITPNDSFQLHIQFESE